MTTRPKDSAARGATDWLRHYYFMATFAVLCWYSMMVLHELGHVLGALSSGGAVRYVELHPLAILRTDVQPNPHPLFVVWSGPVIGCVLPATLWMGIPASQTLSKGMSQFFLGFCLIANGAYIGAGALETIGDTKEMLRHGTPFLVLIAFGITATCCGFWAWHRLGSPAKLFSRPLQVPIWVEVFVTIYLALLILLCIVTA